MATAASKGLLTAQCSQDDVELLWKLLENHPGTSVTVDLVSRTITAGDLVARFEVDDYTRWRLLEGHDDISLTLRHEGDISTFEGSRPSWKPLRHRLSARAGHCRSRPQTPSARPRWGALRGASDVARRRAASGGRRRSMALRSVPNRLHFGGSRSRCARRALQELGYVHVNKADLVKELESTFGSRRAPTRCAGGRPWRVRAWTRPSTKPA